MRNRYVIAAFAGAPLMIGLLAGCGGSAGSPPGIPTLSQAAGQGQGSASSRAADRDQSYAAGNDTGATQAAAPRTIRRARIRARAGEREGRALVPQAFRDAVGQHLLILYYQHSHASIVPPLR